MKKVLVLALFGLMVYVCSHYWTVVVDRGEEETTTVAPQNSAVIACEQPLRAFGTIQKADGVVEHTFPILNNGTDPLVLYYCEGSCGCTTAVWSQEPILPGKTGTVTVTYDPKDDNGTFIKTISVVSNSSNGPLTLTIKGEIQ